ncbi:MAG: ABC transporter transmembrane domain-containing protein, partial [Bacteroidota bacterium]
MSDSPRAAASKRKPEKITKERWQSTLKIFRFIQPYKWSFIFGLLLLTGSSVLFMIFPGAAGEMANAASGRPTKILELDLWQYGLFFLVLLVVQGLTAFFRVILFARVSEKGMADVRKALYGKLISQDITFFEQRRVGELTSRLTTDIEQLQAAFSVTLAEFLRQVITLVVGVAIIAWLTPKLSLIMLMTFPVVVIIAFIFGRYIRRISKKRQDQLAETNVIVEETFQTFSVVKSFTNEWLEVKRYGASVDKVVSISLRFAQIRGVFFIFIITFLFGAIFFVLWQGALLVKAGDMEVGDLFSFILYTGIIGGAIAGIGNLYAALSSAMGATERVQEILDSSTELDIRQVKLTPEQRLNGNI